MPMQSHIPAEDVLLGEQTLIRELDQQGGGLQLCRKAQEGIRSVRHIEWQARIKPISRKKATKRVFSTRVRVLNGFYTRKHTHKHTRTNKKPAHIRT